MTKIKADWLSEKPVQSALSLLTRAGHQAYLVGGCVRNALLGEAISDIDIATSATPDQVSDLARRASLKCVPTGVEHGTVTILVDGVDFEITTFRRDVETDGRHAVVAFTNRVEEDARRRDFTFNAIYADADGTVFDPIGGVRDLNKRQVVFIDDANDRIREDYLRSLRFFRFHAQYGDPNAGLDPDALAAIAANLDGLATLAAERVTSELIKLLSASDPGPALSAMERTGVLSVVMPGASTEAIFPLIHIEQEIELGHDPLLRLLALGAESPETHLRLSRKQTKLLDAFRQAIAFTGPPHELGYRSGELVGLGALAFVASSLGTKPGTKSIQDVRRGAAAVFPINANDLMPDIEGEALGIALKRLEQAWIDDDFKLTREDLLKSP